jgi:hypothetical protein
MQTPAYPSFQSRFKSFTDRGTHRSSKPGFFETHAVGPVVRSLFLSSLLWAALAVGVYMVYSMVLGAH